MDSNDNYTAETTLMMEDFINVEFDMHAEGLRDVGEEKVNNEPNKG